MFVVRSLCSIFMLFALVRLCTTGRVVLCSGKVEEESVFDFD